MKNASFLKRLVSVGSVCALTSYALTSCAHSPYPASDHYDGKRFFNPGVDTDKSFFSVLKWKWTSKPEKWPEWTEEIETPKVASSVVPGEAVVTFVNHATYLIQLPGMNILTDPLFSKRASPFTWIGPARHRPPGIALDKLPPIHVVFISHNHYDHLDFASIETLARLHNPLFIVPLGHKKLLMEAGVQKVVELDWWESTKLSTGEVFHLTQVQHWSSRSLFDRNKALWGGFVLEASGMKIYFGGDSGYGPHYKATKERFGAMDLSLLPIGAYEPRWFMRAQHMNPEEAVQAHLDLASQASSGMHFGTFQLTDESIDKPVEELKAALAMKNLDEKSFYAPKNGETRVYRKR